MRIFIVVLFSMFLLSSCKEELVIFDITVKNQDNSVVTDGFVRLSGYKPSIGGGVALYSEDLSLSDMGEIHIEIPLDPKITEFILEYWDNNTNNTINQTITGCNHEFSQNVCELSGGQKIFDIEIIVL